MFTKKTILSGLQFAVLGTLFSQGILALLFAVITPNFYRAIVTHDFLKNCSWVTRLYPGFLDHTALYAALTVLAGAVTLFLALAKINTVTFVRALAAQRIPPGVQSLFLGGVTAVLVLAAAIASGGFSMSLFFNGASRDSFNLSMTAGACVVFAALFGASLLQWRHMQGRVASVVYSLIFGGLPALAVAGASAHLVTLLEGNDWSYLFEYGYRFHTPQQMALFTSMLFAAGGALLGVFVSLVGDRIALLAPEPLAFGGPPLRRELVAFGAALVALFFLGGLFTRSVLSEKLHFFRDGKAVLRLEAGAAPPRKAIILTGENASRDVALSPQSTYFTDKNVEHLKQYLMANPRPTAYTATASARIIDYYTLAWDLPTALEYQTQRISTCYENTIDVMITIAILYRQYPSPGMTRFVDFLGDRERFAYPGARSCLHIVGLYERYGEKERADAFMADAGTRIDHEKQIADYREKRKDPSEFTGVVDGEVRRGGRPLAGVKVRIFGKEAIGVGDLPSTAEGILSSERRHCELDGEKFLQRTCPNFLLMRNAVNTVETDSSGRFAFTSLPPDEYLVAVLLEGDNAAATVERCPGIVKLTEKGQRVMLQAVELR